METGAILLLSTDSNVAGETCLANPLRSSGFQAARHNMFNIYMYTATVTHFKFVFVVLKGRHSQRNVK
jgi:hypothetical protein